MARTYILDTNVLLHDPKSMFVFEEHFVVIPILVIEELDKFKADPSERGYNARTTARYLNKLSSLAESGEREGSLKEGISLEGGGTLRVAWDGELDTDHPRSTDHAILKMAQEMSEAAGDEDEIILVSRDANLRIKGEALGLRVEDYRHDSVARDPDKQYKGVIDIPNVESFKIDSLYDGHPGYDLAPSDMHPHEFAVITNGGQKSVLTRWHGKHEGFHRIDPKLDAWGIAPRNKEQLFALDLLLDPDIELVTLTGQAGTGKAQPLDAKILTPTGWTTMGELEVGSQVMTPQGTPAKVLGVFPQGEKDIFKVHFTDGSSTECCADHLWETQTCLDRDAGRRGTVKSLKEIKDSLRYGGQEKRNHSIPMSSPVEFEPADLPLDPYLVGCLLGDGSFTTGSPTLSSKDEFIIDECSRLLELIGCHFGNIRGIDHDIQMVDTEVGPPGQSFVRTCPETMEQKVYENQASLREDGFSVSSVYRACSGEFSQHKGYTWASALPDLLSKHPVKHHLMSMGLWGKNSHGKFIPENYLFGSVEQRLSILQGLMDTDGTIDAQGHVSFSTVSPDLMEGLRFLVQSLGGTATVKTRQTSYTNQGERRLGQVSYRVNLCLPNDICPFRLPRKADRVVPRTKYHPRRYIDRVERTGVKEAQCILIDDPDHLYLTDDCIVTHNTLLAIAAGLAQVADDDLYAKLLVSRPVVPMGKGVGFLPGTLEEKLNPWMQPIFDNLEVLVRGDGKSKGSKEKSYQYLFDRGIIEVEALTYIRGRSLPKQFLIVDEAQNLTPHEVKTILTRAGEGTKIILTGDPAQIDNPYVDSRSNGLTYTVDRFKDSFRAGHVTLLRGERSGLAAEAAERL